MTKTKVNGQTRVWQAYRLGADQFGVWLYAPAGTPNCNPSGELTSELVMDGVQLIPVDAWWVAWWWADRSITIDVATPADVKADLVSYLDLELDLWARDGDHGLVDQDEFETVRAAGMVTDEQDSQARSAVADLRRMLAGRDEPFGEIGWQWLGRVRRNDLHVIAYDPSWPVRFAKARDEMLPVLPTGTRIEHFGSTSVPGLAAKDCIDIAVIVKKQEEFDQAIAGLETLGYQARPNAFDDPGHVFIRRLAAGQRTHHLHLYYEGHQNLIEVLAFRDLLREDPEARKQYQAVKLALASANPYDRSGYLAGKTEVVRNLLRVALARQTRDETAS